MSEESKSRKYRDAIDALVDMCRDGQGQVGPDRVRSGVWNPSATDSFMPDQNAVNLLLAKLSSQDRKVLAGLLAQQVETGVFETLKVLENHGIEPFDTGYEGSPYNDFVGRLGNWRWPDA